MKHPRHILQTLALAVALLAVGQNAWATTKTVTYTITGSIQIGNGNNNYRVTMTRSGDVPFDSSGPDYSVEMTPESLYATNGTYGDYTFTLADGFKLQLQWGAGSNVQIRFNENKNAYYLYPTAEGTNKKITYTVSCPDNYYYTTHVMMTGTESGFQLGMPQTSPNSGSIDTDYDSVWNFSETYYSAYSFGQLTVTYSDVPPLSIFESDGENAYKIKDKHDLHHLANYVNNGGGECSGLTFRQTQDITCDNTYVPIGYYNSTSDRAGFSGTYNGQGHAVSGITVSRTGDNTSAGGYIGLFGYVYKGTVENVILANSTFTGADEIGGIVGYNWGGTVQNCRVESTVTIKAGCNGASHHGGIVGVNYGGYANVIGCYSAASIKSNGKSNHAQCGGIAGYNYGGTIKDCLYTGTTIEAADKKGGIVGYDVENDGTFTNNYYTTTGLQGVNGSDQDGARRARTVSLGENVALVGDETAYDLSGLTAIGTGNYALRYYDGTTTKIYSGAGQVLTFAYSGSEAEGYNIAIYVNDVLATDNGDGTYTATMPAADATVTVVLTPIPWSGSGDSANDPYLIKYPSQLDLLATNVNSGITYEGKFFKLDANITYSTVGLGTGESNYTPIGTYSNRTDYYFRGTFDGAGHTIRGIVVNATGSYIGLFGDIGEGATVQDIVLAGSTFTGKSHVGGIVGSNEGGTVQNCRVENTVSLYAGANNAYYQGGIAGLMRTGQIAGCVSAATVSNNAMDDCSYYGGIVGYSYEGTIVKDCLYTGNSLTASDFYGAIAGKSQGGTLSNNYYTNGSLGGVGGDSSSADQDGARRAHTVTLGNSVSITGDKTTYDVSGITAIGTVALSFNDGTSTLFYSGEGQTLTFNSDGTAALGFSVNGVPILGASYTMPAGDISVEADVTPWTGTGSMDNPYIISDPLQLDMLAIQVNNGVEYADTFFKLGADISYSTEGLGAGESNYTPIGGYFDGTVRFFCGTFDGQGHTVSGITVTRTGDTHADKYIGLFGLIGPGATVQNVVLANSTLTGYWYVGGIVGRNLNSTIRNCRVESSVTINAGDHGTDYHGGIAGNSIDGPNAQIIGCVSAAAVSHNNKTSCCYRGGILGQMKNGIVRDCLYTGTTVTGYDNLGGIVGEKEGEGCTLVGNYYTADDLGGVGLYYYSTGTDCDGAMHAVTSATKPEAIGAQTAVYPHGGLTAYENGVYYRGVYYIREDMGGGLAPATALNLVRGTKDGVTAWWGTFYDDTAAYTLSGATAYTMGADHALYRLGDDGSVIPAGTAVVIIATSADAALTAIDTGSPSVTDHAPGGNILQGGPATLSDGKVDGKTPYVLGVNGTPAALGFYKFTGNSIPANKAYYVQ